MIPCPPRAKLCGAVWFARIRQKAVLLGAGELPPEYVARFGHPTGVDNQFLTFFGLTRDDILQNCTLDDLALEAWFLSRPGNSPARIAEWNHIAVNMGRPGFPMTERLPIAKATTYRHVPSAHLETVFELLEADEGIDSTP